MLFGMLAPAQDRIARPAAGRPTKTRSDYVREDLGHLRLTYDWYRHAQNRQVWRDAIQTPGTHLALGLESEIDGLAQSAVAGVIHCCQVYHDMWPFMLLLGFWWLAWTQQHSQRICRARRALCSCEALLN